MSTPEDASLDVGARARALLEGADWDRLARVFAGEATSRERAAIAAWVAADPSRGAAVEALRQAWLDAGTRDPRWAAWSPEAGWHALAPRLAADVTPSSRGLGSASPRVWPRGVGGTVGWRSRAAAASVLIGLSAGLAISIWRHSSDHGLPGREYATAPGQRLSVTLVDGTRFTLAPASRARISADYGIGHGVRARQVAVEGEAYFAVAHDAARPFVVRTRGAVIRDVGTAFDVRAYPEDTRVRIAVSEGEVAVGGVAARAGDVATVGDRGVAVVHRDDVNRYVAWMQGQLVFEDTPLQEVVQDIRRAFAVELTVADSALLRRPITAAFSDQPLDLVLDEVTRAVGAQYERTARGIVIRSGVAAARGHAGSLRLPITAARATDAGE